MITHEQKMLVALRGISACATNCECCRMHVAVALEAMRPPLCDHGYTVCRICKLDPPAVPPGTIEPVTDYGAIRPI